MHAGAGRLKASLTPLINSESLEKWTARAWTVLLVEVAREVFLILILILILNSAVGTTEYVHRPASSTLKVTTPTGIAADNIQGSTIFLLISLLSHMLTREHPLH